jgi:hypothetical protein
MSFNLSNAGVAIRPLYGTCAFSVTLYAMWNNPIIGPLTVGKSPTRFGK